MRTIQPNAHSKHNQYVAACEATKEAVSLYMLLIHLEVVSNMDKPLTLYCDNCGVVINSKEPKSHKRGKHIKQKYHLIREIVSRRYSSLEYSVGKQPYWHIHQDVTSKEFWETLRRSRVEGYVLFALGQVENC